MYSLTDNVSDEPMMVNVSLNDVRVPMEMDTGATCTLIPQSQYERFWPVSSERPILNASPITVNSYGGTPLKVVGEIDVSARLENGSSVDSTKVIIVDSRGPCVIGRVLMRQLGLIEDVNTVSATAKSMEQEFPELFTEGLGCFKDREFKIEVDPNVPPKYCKACTVPYTVRVKIEKELDRLCKEGIVTPVTNSPWAAPLVPVEKPDKIRLCGDYRLTVSRAA